MSGLRCLSSTSSAVLRVFGPRISSFTHHHAAPPAPRLPGFLLPAIYAPQPPLRLLSRSKKSPKGRNQQDQSSGKGSLPRDLDIDYELVYIRGEDGQLSAPQETQRVLSSLNPKTHSLVALALPGRTAAKGENEEAEEGGEEDGAEEEASSSNSSGSSSGRSTLPYPICRIIDKRVEKAQALEKAKAERKKAIATKEVEINWAIAPHDLETKIRRVRDFLGKGLKVELLLLRKPQRSKRKATLDEAQETLRKVREAIQEIPGAKESKGMQGAVGNHAKLFLEKT